MNGTRPRTVSSSPTSMRRVAPVSASASACCHGIFAMPRARAVSLPPPNGTTPNARRWVSSTGSMWCKVPSPPTSTTRLLRGRHCSEARERSMLSDSSSGTCGACSASQARIGPASAAARPPAARGLSSTSDGFARGAARSAPAVVPVGRSVLLSS